MSTSRIRKGARAHLYIKEHMDAAVPKMTDERLANRLGIDRSTAWKLRTQQHRLTPEKIAAIAEALGKTPQELWQPPDVVDLNAIADGAPAELRQKAAEMLQILLKTGT
jgi:transcriptional regulator with XRE-family HTH domain